jgi:hypothetical protein
VLIWEDGGYLNPILDEAYDQKLTVDEFRTAHDIAPDSAENQLQGTKPMTAVVDSLVIGTTELTRNGYDATRSRPASANPRAATRTSRSSRLRALVRK